MINNTNIYEMLMELLFWQKPAETRKTSVLLFIDSRFINDSNECGKMFVARITLAHAFKKSKKMLLSS